MEKRKISCPLQEMNLHCPAHGVVTILIKLYHKQRKVANFICAEKVI
jgi:hypothetical protein